MRESCLVYCYSGIQSLFEVVLLYTFYTERFVDLFMKMDDLHLSEFREMRLKPKGDFDIAFSAVVAPVWMPI